MREGGKETEGWGGEVSKKTLDLLFCCCCRRPTAMEKDRVSEGPVLARGGGYVSVVSVKASLGNGSRRRDDAAAMETRNTQQHSKAMPAFSLHTQHTDKHRPTTQAPSSSHLLPGPAAPASPAPFQAPASALHLSKEHGRTRILPPPTSTMTLSWATLTQHPRVHEMLGSILVRLGRVLACISHSPFLPFPPLFQFTFHPPPAFKHDRRAWPWGWSSSSSSLRTLASLSTTTSPMEAVPSERMRWRWAVNSKLRRKRKKTWTRWR